MIYDLIVVGGGPAGMIAAGHAAESGLKVLLLEKMSKTGRKLGITGKGRCNITNTAPLDEHIDKIKPDGRFLRSAYSRFFNNELVDFMHSIGIETNIERGGRVFPKDGKATEIVYKLNLWVKQKGVEVLCNTRVTDILKKDKRACGVKATRISGRETSVTYRSNSVLVATGGLSYPATGSTGDGYKLAGNLNHKLTARFPALVPLETNSKYLPLLRGLDLRNVNASLYVDGELRNEDFGELSFLENSISGPIILKLSRDIGSILHKKYHVVLKLDLKPALDEQKLDKRLIRDLETYSKLDIIDILRKLLPSPLVKMCIVQLAINSKLKGSEINSVLRAKIVKWIKEVKFTITGCRPFSEAIITSGGIKLDQVEQNTFQSRIASGLYFAGEILDLDGPTGGYNLQIAFSTGWSAAEGVIKNRDKNIAVI